MTQYGHAGQHHGTGAPGCPVDLHHHHDERCEQPELIDRRQRAREAFYDGMDLGDTVKVAAVEAAIETATRVRVDGPLIAQVFPLIEDKLGLRDAENIIVAAFRAAGFEVEQ